MLCFVFCSHIRRVGFARALLPYGHWVVLVWGRVAGITTTRTRSSNWTSLFVWSWIPETWSTVERRRENQGWALFCGERSAGLHNPRGNWEGDIWVHLVSALVFTSTLIKHSHPALTNSPMHFCSFKLWGTILGMGAQLQQEDCYDFDKVTEKIFPNWNKRLEKHVFSHLLYITIFLYYLSE